MTENKDRELTLLALAGKFAEGDKDRRREWVKTIKEAVKAGTLKAREERTQSPGVYRIQPTYNAPGGLGSREWRSEFETVGHTTFAGMPARVVHPTSPRQAVQTVSYKFAPAAVTAWLRATMPSYSPPALVLAWLGAEWSASIPTLPSMLLVKAARIANFNAAKGWPDALTFDELAKLQYPDSKESQADFVSLIKASLKLGAIESITVDRPMPFIAMDDTEDRTWPCPALDRPAFAAFMQAANETESEYLADWLGKPKQTEQPPAAAPVPIPKHESNAEEERTAKRIKAIVETARAFEYDPQAIPWGGKAAIKKECLKKYAGAPYLFTDSTFDKAWKAAKKAKLIEVENVETYRGDNP